MAKTRYVNTKFWSDNFISELNPLDRYLFLYFLTNEHTNISGIYEIPMKTISFETGLNADMIRSIMLERLVGRIDYVDGWICIRNFQKHQSSTSKTVQKGIEVEMARVPYSIKKKLKDLYPKDMVSIPYGYPSIYLNSNLNLNSNSNRLEQSSKTPVKEEKKEIESPFVLKEEIQKLYDNPRRDLNILGLYLEERSPDIKNKAQYASAIKRHLKPAKELVSFTDNQILKAIDYAKKEYKDIYTLETLLKILTK